MTKSSSASDLKPAVSLGMVKRGRGCLVAFCLVFCGVGMCVFVMTFLLPVCRMVRARQWEPAACAILKSRLESVRGDEGTTYRIDIRYEYWHEDQRYEGDRYSFVSGSTSARRWKQRRLREYPAGSERTCYINPDDPGQSVLHRGPTPDIWFGLIPLAFVVVGGVGALLAAGSLRVPWNRSTGQRWRPVVSARRSDGRSDLFKQADAKGALAGLHVESGPVVLSPTHSGRTRLVVTLVFALFWNGIVWTMIYVTWGNGPGKLLGGFLLVFLTPFVLVGLVALAAVGHSLLALFNPRPRLTLDRSAPRLGDELTVSWQLHGQARSVRTFKIWLEGKEIAKYQRGTDTYTDEREFASIPIIETDQSMQMFSGSERMRIPRQSMHSLDAPHNKIVWMLRVTGEIESWPDIDESYTLVVQPLATTEE